MNAWLKITTAACVATLLLGVGCAKKEELPPQHAEQENTDRAPVLRAVGGYLYSNVDKEKWGDFQLVLELSKFEYRRGEPISVRLLLRNTGRKVIRLDGILPFRNIANPPALEISGPDSRRIRTYGVGIPQSLLNDKPIVLESGDSVVLIDADLLTLSGSVHNGNNPGKEEKDLRPFFVPGGYEIFGRFEPSPQIYSGSTSSLEFKIK